MSRQKQLELALDTIQQKLDFNADANNIDDVIWDRLIPIAKRVLRRHVEQPEEDMLETMFAMQHNLELRTMSDSWFPWWPEEGEVVTEERREYLTHWTDKFVTCLTQECAELRDWTPWKHWSQRLGNKRDDVVPWSPEHIKEVRLELVDLFHFYMALCMIWGLTPKMLFQIYNEKNNINHERISSSTY